MHVTIKKWGNSAAVRIPASIMAAAQIGLDQVVDVREDAGRIIIEPVVAESYDLETLIAGMTDQNRHDPVDMGPPVGGEVW